MQSLSSEWVSAPAGPFPVDRQIIIAQGGFTFGSRDDLGPRYDHPPALLVQKPSREPAT